MNKKIVSLRKRAAKNQIDIYPQAEALLANLGVAGSSSAMRDAYKILALCGCVSNSPIKLKRGITPQGQELGRVEGIEKCLHPLCPYCGPESLLINHAALCSQMDLLRKSDHLGSCTTYAGAFTSQHRSGDSLPGLNLLLRGAESSFRQTPLAKQLVLGWVSATEATTGSKWGNGAHIHTQHFYTLNGTDTQAHAKLWAEAEGHFREYFDRHSLEVIGSHRRVIWKPDWISCEGVGLTGFYGRNPATDWNLLKEVTHGNIKNGGVWSALTAQEFAEYMPAVSQGLVSVGGCWVPALKPGSVLAGEVVASIKSETWNQLHPASKRMIRTVVMSPEYWTNREVEAYAEFTYLDLPAWRIDEVIKDRFNFDCACLPGRGQTPPDAQAIIW